MAIQNRVYTNDKPDPIITQLKPSQIDQTNPPTNTQTTKSNVFDRTQNNLENIKTDLGANNLANFDGSSYFKDTKQGLNDLKGGLTQDNISNISNLRTGVDQKNYESGIGRGLSTMEQFTDPNSNIYKNIFNRALDRFDATNATANMNQAVRIANNPNISDSAKRAATAELQRSAESGRANLSGQLSEQASQTMFNAAEAFTSQSINASNYEEGKFKTDAGLALQEKTLELDRLSAEGLIAGKELEQAYKQEFDGITAKYQEAQLALQKEAALSNNENTRLQAEKIKIDIADFWDTTVDSAIFDLKERTPDRDVTIDDIRKDAKSMNGIQKAWESIGNEGAPTDEFIQSRIDGVRGSLQQSADLRARTISYYKQRGYDDTQAELVAKDLETVIDNSFPNSDGSVTILNPVDGKPAFTLSVGPDGEPIRTEIKDPEIVDGAIGDITIDKGSVYQINSDGKKEVVTDVPNNLFGADAENIMEKAKGTKLYTDLVAARADDIIESENWTKLKELDQETYDKVLSKTQEGTIEFKSFFDINLGTTNKKDSVVSLKTPQGDAVVQIIEVKQGSNKARRPAEFRFKDLKTGDIWTMFGVGDGKYLNTTTNTTYSSIDGDPKKTPTKRTESSR